MKSYLGTYHEPGTTPSEASILIFDNEIHIGYRDLQGQTTTIKWSISDLSSAFYSDEQETRICNSKHGQVNVIIKGNEPDMFIRELQAELMKPWHRRRNARNTARVFVFFSAILAVLVALYFLLVPWLSERLASRVSIQTEEQFGNAVFEGLALEGQENMEASFAVNHFFAAMNIPSNYRIRITVVSGETVNAFALPGGHIVVYTSLLREIKTYQELAALLTHEFTHINNRHSTKAIFRQMGSRIFLGLLFGDFGSVSTVLANQADNLKNLNYSRSLEKEADLGGLSLIEERKIDPKGFADLFGHLKSASPPASLPELLASHPDIEKRMEYIRAAANNFQPEEHKELYDIFENLKQKLQP